MNRISSALTSFYRCFAPFLGMLMLIVPFLARPGLIPSILFAIPGMAVLAIWWRHLRFARDVYLEEKALYVGKSGHSQFTIPYDRVTSIRQTAGVRFPPVEIRFVNQLGRPGRVVVIPSHRRYWSLLGHRVPSVVDAMKRKVRAAALEPQITERSFKE
jgi:hypothetical protein